MRRIPALATVSTFALGLVISVAAGSLFAVSAEAQAAAKIARLGTMIAQNGWTVGTVEGKRDTYCATVNSFKGGTAEGDVVLAVARDPAGYGSLAFDFSQKFFKSGSDYEATVTPGGGKPRNLRGRATTEKSLIVQVGTDEDFFKAMVGNTIVISTPVLEGTFGLGAFEDAYKKLVSCAAQLNDPSTKVAAAAVADVEKASLSPIDRAAAEIGKTGKAAGQKLAQADVKQANALDDMEAQLDRDAKAEEAKAREAAAKAAAAQKEINDKIEDGKKEVVRLQTQKQFVERKLLMSSSVNAAAPTTSVLTTTGLNPSAMELEKQQVEAFKARSVEKPQTAKDAAVDIARKADAKNVKIVMGDIDAKAKTNIQPIAETPVEPPVEKAVEKPAAKAEAMSAKAEEKIVAVKKEIEAPIVETSVVETPAAEKTIAAKTETPKVEVSKETAEKTKPAVAAVAVPVIEAKPDEAVKPVEKKPSETIVWNSAEQEPVKVAAPVEKAPAVDLQTRIANAEKSNADAQARLKEQEDRNRQAESDLKARQNAGKKIQLSTKDAKAKKAKEEKEMAALKSHNAAAIAPLKIAADNAQKQYNDLKPPVEPVKLAVSAPIAAPPSVPVAAPAAPVPLTAPVIAPAPVPAPVIIRDESAILDLKKQLAQKDAQNEALKKELDTATAPKPPVADPVMTEKYSKLSEDLTQKQKAMGDLEARMKGLEEERAAEAARAAKAQAELEAARQQLAEMKKTAIEKAANERLAADTAALQAAMALNTAADEDAKPAKTATIISVAEKKTEEAAPAARAVAAAPVVTAPVVASPAVTAPAPAPAAATAVPDNKAEAFLDKIMAAHHIKSTSTQVPAVKAPVVAAEARPAAEELSESAVSVSEKVQKVEAAKPEAVVTAKEDASFFDRFKKILPGKKADVSAAKPANDYPDASDIPVFAGGGITLEKLLGYSGTSRVNFVSVVSKPGEVVRQWTSDNIDGLYEQFPAASNMESQVKSYIDRYRQDCRRSLTVTLKEPRAIAAGMMVQGYMTCADQGNSYATSFVFLENQQVFHALLHTGYPEDLAVLKRIGDNLGLTFSRSSQFLAPQPAMKKPLRRPLSTPSAGAVPSDVADDVASEGVIVAPPEKIAPPVAISAPAGLKSAAPAGSRPLPSASVSSDEFGTVVIE